MFTASVTLCVSTSTAWSSYYCLNVPYIPLKVVSNTGTRYLSPSPMYACDAHPPTPDDIKLVLVGLGLVVFFLPINTTNAYKLATFTLILLGQFLATAAYSVF